MKGVLLAAGVGQRLGGVTKELPKVMLAIGGKPVLEHNLAIFKKAGVGDVIVTLYHKGDAIQGYFQGGDRFGVQITYHRQEALQGSAGDLKGIKNDRGPTFAVMYADNFSNCNLAPVLEYHKLKKKIATVVLFDRQVNANSGISGGCARIGSDNQILEFIEGKGALTPYVNAGIYILENRVLGYIPENTFFDFGRDLFPLLLSRGEKISGYLLPKEEYLFGIDTPECYHKAQLFYETYQRGVEQ